MTKTQAPELTLFGGGNDEQTAVFTVDECKDIVNHGMDQGISGFTYNYNLYDWFNDNLILLLLILLVKEDRLSSSS